MPRRWKYESRTGFTLVEMIVVLLILAVVASMAVPAFSRQIDDAKEKKAVTEAQACVTAGTGLGAQLYSNARSTALQNVSTGANASDAVTAALAGWASSVTDKGPTLTGDPALTEGQGQYYLKPGQLQNGTAAGADKLKAAAGVDGTVENFWCSGTGQIVYLSYRSADGILVAYTNNGTSGSNITIPTPDVPEPDPEKPDQPTDKPNPPTDTPTDNPDKPDDTDHSGDLIFVLRDEFTGEFISGVTFELYDAKGNLVGTQTTDSSGKICFPVAPTKLGYYECWKLVPKSIPEGLQDILGVNVGIARYPRETPTDFDVTSVESNSNAQDYGYESGYTSKYNDSDEYRHVYNFYVRHLPKVEICVWDDATQQPLKDVKLTISRGDNSVSITDSSVVKTVYAKIHKNDQIPASATEYIDLSNGMYNKFHVSFSSYPKDFQYLEDFDVSIYTESKGTPKYQITSSYQENQWDDTLKKNVRTVVTCENVDNSNVTRITIHATQVADVTFHKYSKDDLSLSSIPELSGAHLQLYKADSNNEYTQRIEEWDTGSSAKVITLEAGAYRLEETSAPQDYTKAEPLYFTLMRNTSGKLELKKGVSDASSYVDDITKAVCMVDTPTVKHVGVQIVDITTGFPWAGAKAKLIGEAGGNMSNEDRTWTSSLSDTVHTFRLPLQNGSFTIEVVDSDMFAYSEFKFEVVQDGDGFKLESANDTNASDGTIDNNTITVYAYPKVVFHYSLYYNNDNKRLEGARLIVKDSSTGAQVAEKGKNAQNPWDVKSSNQDKALGIPTGSYTVSETKRPGQTIWPENAYYSKTIAPLTPVSFTVTRNQYNGMPEIYTSYILRNRTIPVDYRYN